MIDRDNAVFSAREAFRLINGPKWSTSRSLRRFLAEYVVPRLGSVDTQARMDLIQSFSSGEGFSPEQLQALKAYAEKLAVEMAQVLADDAPVLRYRGVVLDEAFGLVFNHFEVDTDLASASLKELQQLVKGVFIVANTLAPLALRPNVALQSCPVYVYRGLPCSIAEDERLWAVSGIDLLEGGQGVLEWCYDEEDARDVLASMQAHAHRFTCLEAAPYSSLAFEGNVHPLVHRALVG